MKISRKSRVPSQGQARSCFLQTFVKRSAEGFPQRMTQPRKVSLEMLSEKGGKGGWRTADEKMKFEGVLDHFLHRPIHDK